MKKSRSSLIAIALLLTLLLSSCSGSNSTTSASPSPSETSSASPSESKDYGIPADSVLMTIGDFEVQKSLFRYYYDSILSNYEYEDQDFLKNTENAVEKVAAEALQECKKDAAYFALFNASGETLAENWETDYEAYKSEVNVRFLYYYGISLEDYMEESGMTEEIFKMFYLEDNLYFSAIQKYISEGESPLADLSEEAFNEFAKDYATVRHILVGYTDGLSTEDALARAKELIKRYNDGEDFESLQKQYSNDYQATGDNVYTFSYGEMVEEFEETSFALKIGEISEPVKTQYGYHVILRLPYPDDFNDTHFYPYVTEQYVDTAAKAQVEQKTELYDVVISELKGEI